MNKAITSLKNHFLIAMPSLQEPHFYRGIIYLYEHDEEGATGIVINKAMRIQLGDVFKHLKIDITDPAIEKQPVLLGGPVAQEQGFIIFPPQEIAPAETTLVENDQIIISTSKKILQDMAVGAGPQEARVVLGYAGWTAGQLEEELVQNAWLVAPASKTVLFELPFTQRWQAALTSLGVDPNKLSPEAGHA